MRDGFLLWLQRNSFIIVLLTLLPLAVAVVTSSAGKSLGNMTPWEPAKIPFLVGFAGILTARYKDLAETYWGIPRARDIVPLLVMAMIPFVPFFALKDFGQMLIFSGAYTTLYLVAVRRWPQLLVVCRFDVSGDQYPGRRCAAAKRAGESPAVADSGAPDSGRSSLAYPAAISSVARRFRSSVSRSFLVEEGLRRSTQ